MEVCLRIVIFTFGTRGDTQPYIALAVELIKRGHSIKFLGPKLYADLATSCGVPYTALRGDVAPIIGKGSLARFERWGVIGKWSFFHQFQFLMGATNFERMVQAAEHADCIVFSPLMHFATDISEATGVPSILANMQPISATSEFPLFVFCKRSLGSWLNRLSYEFVRLHRFVHRSRLNHARRRLLTLENRQTMEPPSYG